MNSGIIVIMVFIVLVLIVLSFLVAYSLIKSGTQSETVVNVGVTPAGLAVTPDGKYAYVANNNNYGITNEGGFTEDTVSVIDLSTNLVIKTIKSNSIDTFSQPYTVTINSAGTKVYVTNSYTTTVSVIDTATNEITAKITDLDGPSGFVIVGTNAYVNNYGAGVNSGTATSVSIVDLNTNTITSTLADVGKAPAALCTDSTGSYVYVIIYNNGVTDGSITAIKTSDNTVTKDWLTGLTGPFGIAITTDDKYLYVTNFGSNNFTPIGTDVSVIDISLKSILTSVRVGIQPSGVFVSPNNQYAIVTCSNSLYQFNGTGLLPGLGTVNWIRISDNTITKVQPVGQSPNNVFIFGEKILVSNFVSNVVSILNL